MRNFRYIFSLIRAFVARFKWILLAGISIGVLFFLVFNIFGLILLQKEKEKIGLVGRYRVDNLPNSVLKYVTNGLTQINERGEVSPAIASSWENQDGGKTWIFHLGDHFWQDGKKIVSNDIQIKFSDVIIERLDVKTMVFKLQTPLAPFPAILAKPIFKKGLLGTGDWKVKKVTVSGSIVEQIILTKPSEKEMIFRFYPTEERAKLALKLGEVDKLVDIFNPEPFETWKNLDLRKRVDEERFAAVFFNNDKGEKTTDKTLRQALTYAINKNAFSEERAIGPLSPNSWAYNPQVKPYNYDLAKAKEMIKGLSKEVQNNLTLNIATTPVLLTKAESIAKNWRDLGIEVNVQVSSGIPDNFDAFLAILDIPRDPDQYSLWHSSQKASNIANYQDPRIDKLLEDGRTVVNESERKKIYLDFQRFLVEDSPAAFLYHPTTYTISRK